MRMPARRKHIKMTEVISMKQLKLTLLDDNHAWTLNKDEGPSVQSNFITNTLIFFVEIKALQALHDAPSLRLHQAK